MKTFPAESHLSSRRNLSGRFAGGLLLVALLWSPSLLAQQPADRSVEKTARVTERGAHHAKWETVREVADPLTGKTVSVTNGYVQLEVGLHRLDEQGAWVEASDQIEVLGGEAVARNGQHQARWAANINTVGAIELTTPDGQLARSHVLGLAFFDPATGDTLLIGQIKDSIGVVTGNQVTYEDAFDGVAADLRYTYTRAGFVQDVILRGKVPDPAEHGFDPSTVQLQVLTEFVQRPDPTVEAATESDPLALRSAGEMKAAASEPAIRFGVMTMTEGRAFNVSDAGQDRAISVQKAFEVFEGGREILVESVDLQVALPELEALPEAEQPTASIQREKLKRIAGNLRTAPSAPTRQWARATPVDGTAAPRMLARAEIESPRPGYVIDYDLTGTTNNLTLQGDTTYHVTGLVTATGTTVIEGGTVLKFANTNNAQLKLQGALKCQTGPYRPAIFTAKDDNTVGTTVTGSTGSPANFYATNAIYVDNFAADLKHVKIRYAWRGVYFNWNNSAAQNLSHVQMVKCANGVVVISPNFNVRNALFNEVLTNFHTTTTGINGRIEHLTSDKANRLNGSANLTLYVTNSILSAMTNSSTYTGVSTATYTTGSGVFQTLGAGNYYLASSSTNRDAGSTNVNATLKSSYARMTTYPPTLLSSVTYSANTTMSPVVQRDTDVPDRGYHYAAWDYALSSLLMTNAVLTLTNGVVLGNAGTYGVYLLDKASLVSEGSPLQPNIFTDHSAVQEQPSVWLVSSGNYSVVPYRYSTSSPPNTATLRFTNFEGVRGATHVYSGWDNWFMGTLSATHCEFYAGGFSVANKVNYAFKNCLMHRAGFATQDDLTLVLQNVDWVGGGLFIDDWGVSPSYTVKDSLFHKTTVSYWGSGTTFLTKSNNGFTQGTIITELAHASNKTNLVADFQSGTLGEFYLPASGTGLYLLVNAGSQTSPNAGLYHFTTLTAQTKETTSTVDIGYHYVALNGSGQPVDTDGDGFPDYFEDVNGNGGATPDAGETDWDNVVNQQGPGMSLIVFTPLSK